MRDAIFAALRARMARDPRVFFLCADVGINLVEPIRDAHPTRYLNVGVAEANMVGVAAGLCACGYRPVLYTISNFAVHRCFEQLRDDAALHGYPLVLLGLGTGFDNAQLGPTHHMVDDWGVARNLPGIEVHCPHHLPYAKVILDDVLDRNAFAYIRIPKGKGCGDILSAGDAPQTTLLTYGNMVPECMRARYLAPSLDVSATSRLHPYFFSLPDQGKVVVVEDHFADTGLYSTVCQVVAAKRLPIEVFSRAPSGYYREAGDTPLHFWRMYRGDAESLAEDFG